MNTDNIYEQIKTSFENETTSIIYEESDIAIRMKIISAEIAKLYDKLNFCEKQLFPDTATGDYLERHGACKGVLRKKAAAAQGTLKFSTSSAASQNIIIPAQTLCTSSSGNGVMYETTEEAIIYAGSTNVSVAAQATEVGSHTNIIKNKIDTIANHIAGVFSVTNLENFSGGSETETESHYRTRILDTYQNPTNGANFKYFEDLAMSHDQVYFAKAVQSSSNNTVTLYISDYFRFTSSQLIAQVQAHVNEHRAFNTQITVVAATPITVNVQLKIYVRANGNVGSKSLTASNFITQKIYDHSVGQKFNPYSIGEGLKDIIEDYVDIEFISPEGSIDIAQNQIANPGTVSAMIERVD